MKAQRQRSPAPSGEAIRYLNNARGILRKAPREGRVYTDIKPVREACGTAYLAVLEAINAYLLKQGLTKKELPRSMEAYQKTLRKYGGIHNGKLFRDFDKLYDELHIAGYYRGLLWGTGAVQDAFNLAQQFISKLSK
ncbi:MAG: DUF5618 family protein [Planctomycetes bacterium]|nr:DUF5618 family protein [Planctomycetota bacterium]